VIPVVGTDEDAGDRVRRAAVAAGSLWGIPLKDVP
jgi:hypothetical protein